MIAPAFPEQGRSRSVRGPVEAATPEADYFLVREYALDLRLAREGLRLVLAGRGRADLDLTARAIMALGGPASCVTADLALPGEREKIIQAVRGVSAEKGSGGVDLWVNDAGIGGAFARLKKIELDGEARRHQTLQVNLTGAWLGMVRAILDLRRRGASGGVVNVSTFYVNQAYVFRIPHTAPKILLRKSACLLADALRPYGIFVADIEPSLIDGPRFQWVARNYAQHFRRHGVPDPMADPRIKAWFKRLIPERAPRSRAPSGIGPQDGARDRNVKIAIALPAASRYISISPNEEKGRGLSRRDRPQVQCLRFPHHFAAETPHGIAAECLNGISVDSRRRKGWAEAWICPISSAGRSRPAVCVSRSAPAS